MGQHGTFYSTALYSDGMSVPLHELLGPRCPIGHTEYSLHQSGGSFNLHVDVQPIKATRCPYNSEAPGLFPSRLH